MAVGFRAILGRLREGICGLFNRKLEAPAIPEPQAQIAEAPPTPKTVLTGEGYRLYREIGKGGYGRVWMAEVPGGDLRALKIVEVKNGDTTAFERERSALERVRDLSLSSEFMVPIDDVEIHTAHGFLSYTMPLADDLSGHHIANRDGYRPRSLETELKKHGRLPIKDCIAVTKRILGAVKVLHSKGLIHRDIKPGNVIFLNGHAVLADFGLVTHEGSDISQVCSPSNKPPEGVGAAAGDLRAVGVLLYRLATGNPAEHFPSPVYDIHDPAFPKLSRVFTMAGEDEPSNRYINARAMELALDRVLIKPRKEIPAQSRKLWHPTWKAPKRSEAPDTPGMLKFKTHIRNIVEAGRLDATAQSKPQRDYMNQDEFSKVVANVCLAFERRIGHEPELLIKACLMAQATMEPDKVRREALIKDAAALSGGVSGIGMVITGIGLALGWGQGVIHAVIVFFTGSSLSGPIGWIVGGLTIATIGGYLYFSKASPKASAERAEKALIAGADAAIGELWGRYGDQLSL